ncbi:MAG: AMP-binding protein [Coxiellaceae bacterium]|nr:AMP-binding protein [Coxiellaceae bacterium]
MSTAVPHMENKVWLQHYTHGVPETINPDIFSSLPDYFEKAVRDFSDRPIYTCFGTTLTYQAVDRLANNIAAFLQQKLGLKKGDRIALMMPNTLQYPVAIMGALRAGLIVVNVNPLYTAHELAEQLKDSGAQTIVVLENFANKVQEALSHTDIKNIIITKIGDLLGTVKGAVFNVVSRYIKRVIPSYELPQAFFLQDVLKKDPSLSFIPVPLQNTDVAFLQYTGGTTGRAKGAMLSHRNIISNIIQCAVWIQDVKEQNHGVVLAALPMYHIFSLTVCAFSIFPMGASSLLIPNPRDLPALMKAMKSIKLTMIIGLNTLFNAMLNHPQMKTVDFSRLRLTISGGMAMQKPVADRWQQVTGIPILQGYGLTESSPVITLCPVSMTHFTGTIGLPVSSTEVVIRDEAGNDLAFHEAGEICARGPQVMLGYWHADRETHQTIDDDGWLHTGDIGYMDENGFVFIVDRKKDMVLVSGFNVYPNEVEAVLAAHPGVQTVAVIGVPSEQTGEALKAFIIKKDPAITPNELIAFCRKSLTGYKIPKLIEFRDELPLSPVGKVLRRELRDLEKKET